MPTPVHRQNILLFALALPDQKVPIILQQLLDFQTRDGTMVPTLLTQRLLNLGHGRQNRWDLGGIVKNTILHNKTRVSCITYYFTISELVDRLLDYKSTRLSFLIVFTVGFKRHQRNLPFNIGYKMLQTERHKSHYL